ncbi:PTS system, fructose-specific IIC component [Evansella caseinilytica]|uniref:PTS system, fructose-specific IIC component n=1 Tax=Evansella caseinilytica TaxID=1503961 RepID=A0A1H3J3F6_9BACI|nr:fructose-specific PTS transporter subunit EIIC [Evansella caseinilytica]SDY34069.1 PTS system, fructose-specific IIC component [Evansella caseinilytica]
MKISQLLHHDTMILDLKATSKNQVIEELATALDSAGKLANKQQFIDEIHKREQQSSTGIGDGVAIPHAKTSAVLEPTIVFGRSSRGIDYDSLDGKPSHLFFMIAASAGANNEHLQTLSRLSTLLIDASFRELLMKAATKEEVLVAINEKEQLKLNAEQEEASPAAAAEKYVLAVTGCPTGIAHTYMAADSLKDKAKALGIKIKVETNGSDGVKNRLTADEIARADAIIIAADTKVEKERFSGKRLIEAAVTDGIRRPEELLRKAVSGNAPVYNGEGASSSRDGAESGAGKKSGFYKHLMNGVSNMLPFVVGGGILIAISFIFGIEAFNPESAEYHPFAETLMTIGGGNAFNLMIPVLAAFIAMSIADRPGFAPGMVAGLIAFSGESGFLGGLIAGFLAGYLVVLLKKVFNFMPPSLAGIKTILVYPVFGIFLSGYIMLEFIVGPVQTLNSSLISWLGGLGTGNIVLLGILLGGMMAVDMGGPINKAAFTFGLAMIDAGNFAPHAAIMAGGMVPPLGIALATTLFKNKFTKQEREAGKTNYIMGASFITEGAIPFAAADPGRVIPSIIVGSAVSGGLAMLFGNTLMAPHGGAFVIFVAVENWPLYLLAIAIGSIITALMIGFLKKPVNK